MNKKNKTKSRSSQDGWELRVMGGQEAICSCRLDREGVDGRGITMHGVPITARLVEDKGDSVVVKITNQPKNVIVRTIPKHCILKADKYFWEDWGYAKIEVLSTWCDENNIEGEYD